MPKRSSNKQGPEDINETAFRVTKEAIDGKTEKQQDNKNPAAVALGKLGGKKGGYARAAKLSSEERSEIAKKAASARWGKGK